MTVISTRDQVPHIARPTAVQRRPGQGGGPPDSGMTGRDVLRIIRKRKWLIILSVGISTILTFVGTLMWWLYAPMYTAEAFLRVDPPRQTVLNPMPTMLNADMMERVVLSQAQLVKSEAVLQEAMDEIAKKNYAWYGKNAGDPIRGLQKDLDVAAVPSTNFLRIAMTDTATTDRLKGELAGIVNAVANAVENNSQKTTQTGYGKEITQMTDERTKLADDIVNLRKEIQGFRTDDMRKQQAILEVEMRMLAQMQSQLQLDQAAATAARKSFEDQEQKGELAGSPQVMGYVDQDPTLRALKAELQRLSVERDRVMSKYGPKHLQVHDLENRLASIEAKVAEAQKNLSAQAIDAIRSTRITEEENVNSRLTAIALKYEEALAQTKDLQKALESTQRAEREAQTKEDRINRLENRLTELRLLTQEQAVTIGKPASTPREPSYPKWTVMMVLGVMLGLVVGLGATFALEFMDTSIRSPSDVAKKVDLPLLGMVPHTDDLVTEDIGDVRLAFATNPHSLVQEAFRHIRTCMQFSGPASQRRSLLITSPMPEDGRTTVAMNLAASLARNGRKVLVLDANFRQPCIGTLFPDCPDGGLSSVLSGQEKWEDMVFEVEPNLFVMAAGPRPPNPAELLGSDQMRQLLDAMTAQYEQVLLDGPPAMVVTDAHVLGTIVDAVIMVVRAETSTYGVAQRSRDMLSRVGARLMGVVLNGVRATAGGYLRKNYETFYEYHENQPVAHNEIMPLDKA